MVRWSRGATGNTVEVCVRGQHMITQIHLHCECYYYYKWEENLLELCSFDSRQSDFTFPCAVLQMHLFTQCVHLLNEYVTTACCLTYCLLFAKGMYMLWPLSFLQQFKKISFQPNLSNLPQPKSFKCVTVWLTLFASREL